MIRLPIPHRSLRFVSLAGSAALVLIASVAMPPFFEASAQDASPFAGEKMTAEENVEPEPAPPADPGTAPAADLDGSAVDSPADAETAVDQEFIENPLESESVRVDWIEEIGEGGITMVFLGILSVALLAFLIERFLTLRPARFVPPAFMKKVRPLFAQGKFDEIRSTCDANPSAAAEIVRHCVDFRETPFETLQSGANDIGARVVLEQEERCTALGVISGVAPLLGLLGTMIGMIESFKLVEVFGDEGGASLLAGSISKALITTAVGLILAIPAVLGFNWARRRVHRIGAAIEIESEDLLKDWFLRKSDDDTTDASN